MQSRLIYTLFSIFAIVSLSNGQPFDTRATIHTDGLKAVASVQPTSAPITFPNNPTNIFAIIVFSLPANGLTNPASAPQWTEFNTLPGLNTTVVPVEVINDRFVYM